MTLDTILGGYALCHYMEVLFDYGIGFLHRFIFISISMMGNSYGESIGTTGDLAALKFVFSLWLMLFLLSLSSHNKFILGKILHAEFSRPEFYCFLF